MEDEKVKKFQLELKTFGARNKQRFHILQDLTLACDACKTTEARVSITEMTRRYFDELRKEEQSLNKRIDKMLKDAAKKGEKGDKAGDKQLEAQAKKLIDQFTSANLGKNKRLKLKFNGLKKLPYVIFEMKF